MTDHTPTPWQQHDNVEPYGVSYAPSVWGSAGPGYGLVADLRGCGGGGRDEAIANAKLIVKAVNNHDALVQALQALVDQVNDYERVNNLAPNSGGTECWDTVAHAKRVLALVGSPRGQT